MDEMIVVKSALNPPLLDAALRAALGDLVGGLSAAHGEVRVHFTRRPSAEAAAQARQIVEAHDAQARSSEQQAADARRALLLSLRRDIDHFDLRAPLTADAFDVAVRWLLLCELARTLPSAFEKEDT